jgi:hypothetical protein
MDAGRTFEDKPLRLIQALSEASPVLMDGNELAEEEADYTLSGRT